MKNGCRRLLYYIGDKEKMDIQFSEMTSPFSGYFLGGGILCG